MNQQRRTLLNVGTLVGAAALMRTGEAAAQEAPPSSPAVPPGKPGEFDFLAGEWKISHRRLPPGATGWDVFEGEATCWTILGGVGSIEELRIPSGNFSGMGLRLLDVEKREWSDFWVNAKSGVLTAPGQTGGFVNGAGIFEADEMDGDTPIKVRGVWDNITGTSCRWRQSISRDAGATWQDNWVMEWKRV